MDGQNVQGDSYIHVPPKLCLLGYKEIVHVRDDSFGSDEMC